MKRNIVFCMLACMSVASFVHAKNGYGVLKVEGAQSEVVDSVFRGTVYNSDYKVYIKMDLYENNITVPGQEVFGEMSGFLRSNDDSRCWLFTSAEVDNAKMEAIVDVINDYGSEDLTATLKYNPSDSTFTLKQGEGSTIKIARNRKWVKLPSTMVFKRR